MASPRLFFYQSELRLQQHERFLKPWKLFCTFSSEKSAPTKAEEAREKKAEAVKSLVQRYMTTDHGLFSKTKQVHDVIGGSWNALKVVLSEVKTKMLPEPQVDTKVEHKDVLRKEEGTLNTTCSEAIADSKEIVMKEEGSPDANCSEEIMENSKFDCNRKETRKFDLEESAAKLDNTAAVLPCVVQSHDMELSNCKPTELSTLGISTADSQQLAGLPCQSAEQEETSILVEMSTEATPCQKVAFQEVTKSTDSEQNFHQPVKCQHATLDLQVTVADTSKKAISALVDLFKNAEKENCSDDSEEKVVCMADFFKSIPGKEKDLNSTKLSSLKLESSQDLEDGEKHVGSLVSVLTRHQRNCIDNELENYLRRRQKYIEDSEKQGVEGILDLIIGKSKDKYGSMDKETCNKRNSIDNELKDKAHESILHIKLNDNIMDSKSMSKNVKKSRKNGISFEVEGTRQDKDTSMHGTQVPKVQLKKDDKSEVCTNTRSSEVLFDDSDSEIAALDYATPSGCEVPFSNQGQSVRPLCEVPVHSKHRLLLKFVPKTATANDIYKVYGDCGPIADIRIFPARNGNKFNYARVAFKTKEGLETALSRTDLTICGADFVVEPTSHEDLQNEIEKVKEIDYPMDFLRDPTCTVLIEGLPNNLSFSQLESALSTYGCVSGLAMGSSATGIYVEFETEESKERVLAAATVSVLGEKLSAYRVDPPRTTVVRISGVNPSTGTERIQKICGFFGSVKRVISRDIDTFDVQFKLTEWPNMVKILNRLNGLDLDNHQWHAQPSTFVPFEVIQILWSKPAEKKHVLESVKNLCTKIDYSSVDYPRLVSLIRECYGKGVR